MHSGSYTRGSRAVRIGVAAASRCTRDAALYVAICAFGLATAYWPTWSSGFARMQAERSDSLHLNYVLEHQFRQITDIGAVGTYWSPGYFYPVANGLAYSESLLGTLPIYALARTFVAPTTAFQLWGNAVLAADFACMVLCLRRLGVRATLAAAGGFVFAFGLTRAAHLNHAHLLPHFAAPIALWAAIRWFESPSLRPWIGLWAALGLQLLMGIQLGWFLLLALGAWAVARLALEPSAARSLVVWFASEWRRALATVAVTVAVLAVALAPYVTAHRAHGDREDAVVPIFAPRIASWFTAPDGTLPAALGLRGDPATPFFWEHELFLGFVPLLLGLATVAGPRSRDSRERSTLALLLAALGLAALSLYWPHSAAMPEARGARELGWTAWWWVWDWLPGASSIRAVGRVWSSVQPLLVVGGWLGLEQLLRRRPSRPLRVGAFALMALAVVEQVRVGQPSFDKQEHLRIVARWREQIPADCRAVYFAIPRGEPFSVQQMRALWASLDAGKPTINGYSSNYPAEYPNPKLAAKPARIDRWVRLKGVEGICYVTPLDR